MEACGKLLSGGSSQNIAKFILCEHPELLRKEMVEKWTKSGKNGTIWPT